jgi:hypothetical protein
MRIRANGRRDILRRFGISLVMPPCFTANHFCNQFSNRNRFNQISFIHLLVPLLFKSFLESILKSKSPRSDFLHTSSFPLRPAITLRINFKIKIASNKLHAHIFLPPLTRNQFPRSIPKSQSHQSNFIHSSSGLASLQINFGINFKITILSIKFHSFIFLSRFPSNQF